MITHLCSKSPFHCSTPVPADTLNATPCYAGKTVDSF